MPLEDFQGHTLDLSEAMMGERLRKSVSYEVPAMKQEEESTTSSTSDEKAELSFHGTPFSSVSYCSPTPLTTPAQLSDETSAADTQLDHMHHHSYLSLVSVLPQSLPF